MIKHISASVDGMLNMSERDFNRAMNYVLSDDDGNLLPAKVARKHLQLLQSKGIKLVASDGCDNFDPQTGCLCHESEAEEAA